jgi:hypothetical protein
MCGVDAPATRVASATRPVPAAAVPPGGAYAAAGERSSS